MSPTSDQVRSRRSATGAESPTGRGGRARRGPATDAELLSMSREAHLAILNRLANDVLVAVADGDTAVPESSRLAVWVRADLIPWAQDRARAAPDDAGEAALRSDCGVLDGLDSLLTGASGAEAAKWARRIHRTATILLARMEYLED